jgi:hypothetical protein
MLDHDLGGEIYVDTNYSNTGSEVVRWIEKNKPDIKEIVVHSYNSSAVLMSSNLDIMLREFHLIMIGRDKMKKKTFKMTRDEVIEELMDEWWNDLEEKVAEDMIKVYLEEVGAELIVEDSKHRIDDPFWLRR